MVSKWHDFKVVCNTLSAVIVIGAVVGTVYFYKSATVVQAGTPEVIYERPNFEHTSNKTFLNNVTQCVDYITNTTTDIFPVPLDLLLAQAALESGWGTSRFAREGKNLFGMRTYNLTEPHMLPSNKPRKWGVKVYEHECDSVMHYINTLNNGTAFGKYQKLRDEGETDAIKLLHTLESYASDKNYFVKVEKIIKKIRTEYR
jgi:uncharacterized FlgJ-related protein